MLNFLIFFFTSLSSPPTSNLSSSGRSHVGPLFASEEQKSLARDVIDTYATYTGLVYGVIDTL